MHPGIRAAAAADLERLAEDLAKGRFHADLHGFGGRRQTLPAAIARAVIGKRQSVILQSSSITSRCVSAEKRKLRPQHRPHSVPLEHFESEPAYRSLLLFLRESITGLLSNKSDSERQIFRCFGKITPPGPRTYPGNERALRRTARAWRCRQGRGACRPCRSGCRWPRPTAWHQPHNRDLRRIGKVLQRSAGRCVITAQVGIAQQHHGKLLARDLLQRRKGRRRHALDHAVFIGPCNGIGKTSPPPRRP